MNFEIKSTFNKIINAVSLPTITRGHSVCMLSINLASLLLVVGLYLENIILPATYGSGSSAAIWLFAFKVSTKYWTVTTAFATLHLLYTGIHRTRVFIFLKNGAVHLLAIVTRTLRVQLIQLLLVIHLLRNLERYTQHRFLRKPVLFTQSIQLSTTYY